MNRSANDYLAKFKAGRSTWNHFSCVVKLGGVDLSDINFGAVDVSGYLIEGCNLTNADISGFKVDSFDESSEARSSVSFRQSRLVRVKAVGARLANVDFGGADLTGADFRGADLYGASLSGADCRGADFSEAILDDALLCECKLDGCSLFNTRLPKRSLHRANGSPNPGYDTVDFSHVCWIPQCSDMSGRTRIPARIGAEMALQERFDSAAQRRKGLEDTAFSLYGRSIDQLSPEELGDLLS
jgi:uncharacterized protein YjbI with pentapeptide repeats